MGIRRTAAILSARVLSLACRLAGKQGVTMAGKLAMKIDPKILRDLSAQVREKIFVVCGTNGKTTTNNLLCSAIEAEGKKVVCNHTGSNMLMGVAAAFVLSAKWTGKLDADYACIEIDEASAVRVFPHFKPDYMVITNMFRDQLDRYGEIDITIDLLKKAIAMDEKLTVVANADDPLVAYLAESCDRQTLFFGISPQVFAQSNSREIREGRFCKFCGERLAYRFYHYGQMGAYHCPGCGFTRPVPLYDAQNIDMRDGLSFDIVSSARSAEGLSSEGSDTGRDPYLKDSARSRHIFAPYRGFYNIYNILAAYAAASGSGMTLKNFEKVLADYDPQNGRNELFEIEGCRVLLNLAKNPAGFNQNIQSVMEDPADKDVVIVINDNEQDGTDISWLWDVDFDRFGESSVKSILVSGIRCHDMRLRLKYAGIDCQMVPDVKEAVADRIHKGCKNLYVLVNYTALYSTHMMLTQMQGGTGAR